MGKANKFAGSLGRLGDTASGGSRVNGDNKGLYNSRQDAGPKGATVKAEVRDVTHPGDNMGTQTISTHNNINAFTRTAKSRGPYSGPSFRSMSTSYEYMQRTNTSSISEFKLPSGGKGGGGMGQRGSQQNMKQGGSGRL